MPKRTVSVRPGLGIYNGETLVDFYEGFDLMFAYTYESRAGELVPVLMFEDIQEWCVNGRHPQHSEAHR